MDDLISRSEVIDLLKQTGIIQDNDLGHLVVDEINRIPTAYDVDAVVAELEEEREYSYADFEEYVNEKSPCLDAEYDDFFHRGLERAVKIVRKGGVIWI